MSRDNAGSLHLPIVMASCPKYSPTSKAFPCGQNPLLTWDKSCPCCPHICAQGNLHPPSCSYPITRPGIALIHAFRFPNKTAHLEQVSVVRQKVFFSSGDYSELFCSLILEAQRQGVGFSPLKGTALAESSEQCLLREERKTVICSGYMEQGWGSGMEEETEEIFDDCRRPEDRSTCQRDVAHSPYWAERYHCTFFSLLTQES